MSEVTKMIQLICDEKGLAYDTVMEAVETALAAAFRKDFGNRQQNIKVKFDPEMGDIQAWDVKEVVEDVEEDVLEKAQEELSNRREEARKEGRELTEEETSDLARFNPKLQIMITAAKEIKKNVKVGDIMEIALEVPGDFGRMAAQTAKQVIIQKLREAERNIVFDDFKNQEQKVVQGIIQRRDRGGSVVVDLGKITGILPFDEQVRNDMYRPGAKMKFFVISVEMTSRGPEILLSRANKNMVQVIFTQEIPEIESGEVEIKGIARDPGNRSKVSVWTADETIDPIGSCIGQRGSRINTIIEGLGGEKVDIIQFNNNANDYIKHAMSPAKVLRVEVDEDGKTANVVVAPDQYSLAIGRGGANVRLASELTGYQINVMEEPSSAEATADKGEGEKEAVVEEVSEEEKAEDKTEEEK